MYARALTKGHCRRRFLPGSKSGRYVWAQQWGSPRVLVEGLFDVAPLWPAGFDKAVPGHAQQRCIVESRKSRCETETVKTAAI